MKKALANYRNIAPLAHARRLLAADAISKAGDWILFVAMSALVFEAGGARALALFSLMRVLIPFVLGPWAGRWGAALAPRTLMIGADLARAVLLFLGAVAAGTGQSVWLLESVVVGCAVLTACHAPAERRFQRDLIALGGTALGMVVAAVGTSTTAWAFGITLSVLAATAYIPALRQHRAIPAAAEPTETMS